MKRKRKAAFILLTLKSAKQKMMRVIAEDAVAALKVKSMSRLKEKNTKTLDGIILLMIKEQYLLFQVS